MLSIYSNWPVILIPYNRRYLERTKESSLILSMIILGKKFWKWHRLILTTFIQELKELWHDAVQTLDSSNNETFKMWLALMWTISDFPGLGNLFWWITYTQFSCPTYKFVIDSYWLNHRRKWCFIGHRCFLERYHGFRFKRLCFNEKIKQGESPVTLSGSDILKLTEGINVNFLQAPESNNICKRDTKSIGKTAIARKWRRRSIFFDLPYWSPNLLRHNIDVMHIEKNICENVIYSLLSDS